MNRVARLALAAAIAGGLCACTTQPGSRSTEQMTASEAPEAVSSGEAQASPVDPLKRRIALPDGRNMAIRCSGRGTPTVILEAGLGPRESLSWAKLQSKVQKFSRVCSYDRAGDGDSDPGPKPRDGLHITSDLNALLKAAGEAPPYVLVGHSFGGLLIRLYAARYPDEVQGLVFVDPGIPEQYEGDAGESRRARWSGAYHNCLKGAKAGEIRSNGKATGCLPSAPTPASLALFQKPETWETQISELENFDDTVAQIKKLERQSSTLRVIVLTAMNQEFPPLQSAEENQQLLAKWVAAHDQVAALSSRGVHRQVDKAAHYIHMEQPNTVVAAIKEARARN